MTEGTYPLGDGLLLTFVPNGKGGLNPLHLSAMIGAALEQHDVAVVLFWRNPRARHMGRPLEHYVERMRSAARAREGSVIGVIIDDDFARALSTGERRNLRRDLTRALSSELERHDQILDALFESVSAMYPRITWRLREAKRTDERTSWQLLLLEEDGAEFIVRGAAFASLNLEHEAAARAAHRRNMLILIALSLAALALIAYAMSHRRQRQERPWETPPLATGCARCGDEDDTSPCPRCGWSGGEDAPRQEGTVRELIAARERVKALLIELEEMRGNALLRLLERLAPDDRRLTARYKDLQEELVQLLAQVERTLEPLPEELRQLQYLRVLSRMAARPRELNHAHRERWVDYIVELHAALEVAAAELQLREWIASSPTLNAREVDPSA